VSLSRLIPWQAKILAKIVLSRLPVANAIWHRMNMFSHGAMDRPEYALGVFHSHYNRTHFGRKELGFVALEIGPGDSISSAIIARAHGASRCVLVDAGSYATKDLKSYRAIAKLLADRGLDAPVIGEASSLDEILAICGGVYLTNGFASLRDLPSGSVDFIWSHAVLEHIRRDEFLPTMKELRRIIRLDGACSHRVDLQDHLGGGLNNMRIPTRLWERDWMARSGFYTNRIRMRQMVSLFEEAGFVVDVPWVAEWSRVPTARSSLAREFQHLPDTDLLVYAFDALLRPA
jgi:SAM-dependent methyltransferase